MLQIIIITKYKNMNLSKKQLDNIIEEENRRMVKVLKGTKSFSISDHTAERELGVINETFHKPSCYVKEIKGDKVLIEATYYGSGTISNHVRHGWIYKSDIEVKFPWFKYYKYKLLNFLKNKRYK